MLVSGLPSFDLLLSQLPERNPSCFTPFTFTPFTRLMPAANSGLSKPESAAA
jgi:hypothetical protein